MIDLVDGTYRRRGNRQLTIQDARHTLARDGCHGRRGRIHPAYREGQEDQLGSLGSVLNAIVLWNSRCLDASVTHLRAHPPKDREVLDEDVAWLSPLSQRHINLLGRYSFAASRPREGLRPLRDPAAREAEEDLV